MVPCKKLEHSLYSDERQNCNSCGFQGNLVCSLYTQMLATWCGSSWLCFVLCTFLCKETTKYNLRDMKDPKKKGKKNCNSVCYFKGILFEIKTKGTTMYFPLEKH